jgi:formylglycine-generating enzyme required for sulfatase activity
MTDCGASSESCCANLEVPGGTYFRTFDIARNDAGLLSDDAGMSYAALAADGGPSGEADPATVSSFRLDKYLVTVGRFRQFVAAWNGGAGYTPPAGSGKHTHLNGGSGLNATGGGYEPGWVATDDINIAPTDTNLSCDATYQTWTSAPGVQETLPINCVTWYEAYAFCIWDGGFLPSEAEWEYATAGGSQQREYPWGATDPGSTNQYAIYGCNYPSPSAICANINIAPVGTATLGTARWGQLDLAGELWEWNLDWNATYADPCTDCADTTENSDRVVRGGFFGSNALRLLTPNRGNLPASLRVNDIGFRCTRTP